MPEDWYSPGEVNFTRKTARWLIQNLGTLRDGHWPLEASNYIDANIRKKGVSQRAPFATSIEYAAEISTRLEKCGEDGLILLAIECWGETEASLARYFNKPERVIRARAKTALGYVASGPARRWHTSKKRKGETYQEFIARSRRRVK